MDRLTERQIVDGYVFQRNIFRYADRLKIEGNLIKRQMLQKLLVEELAKQENHDKELKIGRG